MHPDEYQILASRTEVAGGLRPTEARLAHAARGIAGEAGEVCAEVEKWLDYGRALDAPALRAELGDLLWYVALACNALGVRMGDVMAANLAKLRVRYPERFDDSRNLGRDHAAEAEAARVPPARAMPHDYDYTAAPAGGGH